MDQAQGKGLPVITTCMTSLPEIAGDGAHFVNDPYDEKELQAAIEKIREDEQYRSSLIKAGFENIKRFRNHTMIKEYQSLYEQLGSA